VLGKAEFLNPGMSVKDRAALFIINAAEKDGSLKKGGLVIEATAGNTGLALATIANTRGYRTLFTCPAYVSDEKVASMKMLGAEVRLCPKVKLGDPLHFQSQARTLALELGGFYCNQFYNINNFEAHYATTGLEIWNQTSGKIDALVSAPGTGGTLGGAAKYLLEKNPNIKVFMVDVVGNQLAVDYEKPKKVGTDNVVYPLRLKTEQESAVKRANETENFAEGIGASTIYEAHKHTWVSDMFYVTQAALTTICHYLVKNDGICVGPSAGANIVGAYLASKKLGPGHVIVSFLCDHGSRYISKTFNPKWCEEKGFNISQANTLDFLKETEKINGLES